MTELVYNRINWVNGSGTPLNDSNLNKMDAAILELVERTNTNTSAIDIIRTDTLPKLQTATSTLEGNVSGHTVRLNELNTRTTEINDNLVSLTSKVDLIDSTVGDTTTGLIKEVNTLKTSKTDVTTTTNLQNQVTILAGQIEDWGDHTHETATTSKSGFLHFQDKIKLDGIEAGATHVEVENTLTSDSTNKALSAAQGKALNTSIGVLTTELGNVKSLTETTNTSGMKKSVYDADNDGVVDNSKKLDGKDLSYFATAEAVRSIQNSLENVEGVSVSWKAF